MSEIERKRSDADINSCFDGWELHLSKLTHIPNVVRWHDDIQFRIWREKKLLIHTGTVSDDWEKLLTDINCFQYLTGIWSAKT